MTPTESSHLVDVLHHAHHPNYRRGMNRLQRAVVAASFVVQRDVPTRHGSLKSLAGLRNPSTGHGQLPKPLRSFRRRKIEIVGNRERLRTHTAQIAGSLSHSSHGTPFGIECHPAIGAINRGSHTTRCGLQGTIALLRTKPNHSGIGSSRRHHGIG